ncbi:hypothetical protein D9756_007621 [Leucocoprinus leucothites]|uniref:Uncharacterized protein n=1 Tax=Leucocoprinus leucothites TaxID=201217 RepID=A0A8H5FX49_9AGAR|nr:hypothetical protein D9756_007621 [Leucoagaricus leucothites]
MHSTQLALLVFIFSPLAVSASHIPRRLLGFPVPVPVSAPAPVPAPAFPGPPAPPGPLNSVMGAAVGQAPGGLPGPGKPAPPSSLKPRRARIEQQRRQFHNADFAPSGSLPSSNIDSAVSTDDVHERRFAHELGN